MAKHPPAPKPAPRPVDRPVAAPAPSKPAPAAAPVATSIPGASFAHADSQPGFQNYEPPAPTTTVPDRGPLPARAIGGPAAQGTQMPTVTGGPGFKVRALELGYYDEKRRRVGDVFTLLDAKHFSKKWMERVGAAEPERATTGNQAIRQKHDETLGAKLGGIEPATGATDVLGE